MNAFLCCSELLKVLKFYLCFQNFETTSGMHSHFNVHFLSSSLKALFVLIIILVFLWLTLITYTYNGCFNFLSICSLKCSSFRSLSQCVNCLLKEMSCVISPNSLLFKNLFAAHYVLFSSFRSQSIFNSVHTLPRFWKRRSKVLFAWTYIVKMWIAAPM